MFVAAAAEPVLRRQLGLLAVTALVVGEVVAIGIFLTPAGMARSLGSPFWLLIVWLLMGSMALSGALCYGELAARAPEAGGGYVYLREAYGSAVSFLYGWKCMLVMDPGITAALAVGLASYVGYALGLAGASLKLIAIGTILLLAAINIAGLRFGSGLMQWLTALKLGALGLLAVLALVTRAGQWSNFVPFVAQRPGSDALPGALAPALVGAFFAFGGWWEISKLAGEARDPARTVPRALAIGVSIIAAIYILTSAVFLYLVPLDRVTSGETFAAQAGEALFGAAGGKVFALIVIVAVLGSLLGLLMALPRVYYAMARDGVFFKSVGVVHPRFGTPARAIVIQAAVASVYVALGTFNQIIAYFVFVTVLFVGLTVAGLFRIRRRSPASVYRTWGYPLTPALFLVLVVVLLVLLAGHNPLQAGLGVAIVALGAPVYVFLFRRPLTLKPAGSHDVDSNDSAA